MWTRRVLLATLVAAAAVSVARQMPAPAGGSSYAMQAQALLIGAQR